MDRSAIFPYASPEARPEGEPTLSGTSPVGEPTLSWNLALDVRELLSYQFMVNALEAGTIVAVMAGVVGWYMVLRRQSFAGHTVAVMAFPGASGAALAGLPERARLLPGLRPGRADDRTLRPHGQAWAQRRVGRDRCCAGRRPGRRLSLPQPLQRGAGAARVAALRHVRRDRPARCSRWRSSRRSSWARSRSWAGRSCWPRSTPTSPARAGFRCASSTSSSY